MTKIIKFLCIIFNITECDLFGHTNKKYISLYTDYKYFHCYRCGNPELIKGK